MPPKKVVKTKKAPKAKVNKPWVVEECSALEAREYIEGCSKRWDFDERLPPAYQPDEEYLHNLVCAEVAVQLEKLPIEKKSIIDTVAIGDYLVSQYNKSKKKTHRKGGKK